MYGREREQRIIDSLLRRAGAARGAGLVISGEPGIGKTALLDHAQHEAGGFRTLRAVGWEAEGTLPYATLHQLIFPVLGLVTELPTPQARALGLVLGQDEGPTPDRFLVALSVLSLLSEAARDRPVLCLVDDVHWADRSTLDVLSFVGRRVAVEPIALLLATRSAPPPPPQLAGLETLAVGGLGREAARALLVEVGGRRLTPSEQDELITATGGNPLALREFARSGLRPSPVGEPLPLAGELQHAFRTAVRSHDVATQRLLLLIAAAGAERADVLRRAATELGLDLDLLDEGKLDDLVEVDDDRLGFRHPLIRSAAYHDAPAQDRRSAHRALAESLRHEPDPFNRRAWHRAQAADGPDEAVAEELARAAQHAARQAGPATAAAFFERAASLSPTGDRRDPRLVRAAGAWLQAGDIGQATALLDSVDFGADSPDVVADVVADQIVELRALVALRAGDPADAVRLMAELAPSAVGRGSPQSGQLLLLLAEASFVTGVADVWPQIAAAAGTLTTSAAGADQEMATLLRGVHSVLTSGSGGDSDIGELPTLERLDDPYTLVSTAGMLSVLGRFERSKQIRERAMRRARASGAAGSLAWILISTVIEQLLAGRLAVARAYAEEGRHLAEETNQPNTACRHQSLLALCTAYQGDQTDTRRLADAALTEATGRNLPDVVAWAHHALGLSALVAGQAGDALRRLEAMSSPGREPARAVLRAIPDLVEAAVRAGEPARAVLAVGRFDQWAANTRAVELRALSARCHALLGSEDAAEAGFEQALSLHAQGRWPLETARTQLLLGEHLRRKRRRGDAQAPLRDALHTFTRLGATVWADRARAELRAAGQPSADPSPDRLGGLTAQELRIALAVGEGATNREIAAQLFLSPRTVDYHLRKVFTKLEITSRADLMRIVLADAGWG